MVASRGRSARGAQSHASSPRSTTPKRGHKLPRSVRGVAEALDQRNLRAALQRSEAALERLPANLLCKAFRAVCLERTGEREQALAICREVTSHKPADPHVLTQCAIVFRRAGLYTEITQAYEAAVAEVPNHQEISVALLSALAAEGRLPRQQQVAIKLFRATEKMRYLLWAVGTILLQVASIGPHRSLELAEALLQQAPVRLKQLGNDGAPAWERREAYCLLLLHLTTLRQQGKRRQALDLLREHSEALPVPRDAVRLRFHLLAEHAAAMAGAGAAAGAVPAAGAREAAVLPAGDEAAEAAERAAADVVEAAREAFLLQPDQWLLAKEYVAAAFRAQGLLKATAPALHPAPKKDGGDRGSSGEAHDGAPAAGVLALPEAGGARGAGEDEAAVPAGVLALTQGPPEADVVAPAAVLSATHDVPQGSGGPEADDADASAPAADHGLPEPDGGAAQGQAEADVEAPVGMLALGHGLPEACGADGSDEAPAEAPAGALAVAADEHPAEPAVGGGPAGACEVAPAGMLALTCEPPEPGDGGAQEHVELSFDDLIDGGGADPQPGQHVRSAYLAIKALQSDSRQAANVVPWLAELEMRALALACSEWEAALRAAPAAPGRRAGGGPPGLARHPDYEGLVEAICSFFQLHAHRGGCYTVLKPYLCLLDDGDARRVLAGFAEALRFEGGPAGELSPAGSTAAAGSHPPSPRWQERAGSSPATTVAGATASVMVAVAQEGAAGWASYCEHAQRRLCLARSHWGLGALRADADGAGMARRVAEVDGLLATWEEARRLAARDNAELLPSMSPPARFRNHVERAHGLRHETRPTLDPDDFLLISAAHLVELDREHCARLVAERGPGHLPSLHDRVYILDALTLLELGTKVSPSSAGVRLQLACVYGALGSLLPMKRWYDSLACAGLQLQCGPAVLLLDRLITHASWEDALELCRRIKESYSDLECAAREELSYMCEHGGARSVHRSREFIAAIDAAKRNVTRGRCLVDGALLQALTLGSFEEMIRHLDEQAEELAQAARRPTHEWVVPEDAAFGVLPALHSLPRCSPLCALQAGLLGAPRAVWPLQAPPGGHARWAASMRPPRGDVLCSVAAWWPGSSTGRSGAPESAAVELHQPLTALEEAAQLHPMGSTPGALRLRALLLLVVRVMLQTVPAEPDLAELLHDFQGSLAAEGFALQCNPQEEAPYDRSQPLPAVQDARGAWPPPWRPRLASIDDLFWRCILVAFDVAHRTLQATPAGDSGPFAGLTPSMLLRLPPHIPRTYACFDKVPAPGPSSLATVLADRAGEDNGRWLLEELLSPIGAVAWESLRRGLVVLRLLVRECASAIKGEPRVPGGYHASHPVWAAGENGDPTGATAREDPLVSEQDLAAGEVFRLGGHGVQAAAAFLAGPVLVLIPALRLVSLRLAAVHAAAALLEAVRSPGRAAELARPRGPGARDAAAAPAPAPQPWEVSHAALVSVAEELRNSLKELHDGLLAAQWEGFEHLPAAVGAPAAGGEPQQPLPRARLLCGERPLQGGVDFERLRRQICGGLVTSHRKQLAIVENALRCQMALLKTLDIKKAKK